MALAEERRLDLSKVELATMRRRHLRQVMKIEAQVYPRPWSSALFLQEIVRRADRVYVVAKYESNVIGYGGLITSGLEAHITTIAVDPAYHRSGVGTKLMIGLLDAAISRGGRTLSLEVRRSNEAALRLYEKFGFKVTAVRHKYYENPEEDGLILWMNP